MKPYRFAAFTRENQGNSLRSEALIIGNPRNTGSGLKQRYEFLSAQRETSAAIYIHTIYPLRVASLLITLRIYTSNSPTHLPLRWTEKWTWNQQLGSSAIAYSVSKTLTLVFQGCKDLRWTCRRYRAGRATSVETLGITLVSDR